MKRLAILLAAVGVSAVGTGCGPTCDSGALQVDWSFVDTTGRSGLLCDDGGLSNPIADVDIYVDGALAASLVPCTDYAAVIAGLSGGTHDIVVEGFDSGNAMIARDFFSTRVCGDTLVSATPGEGNLEILPNACEAVTTYLLYQLQDITLSPTRIISEITPTSGSAITPYTCAGGITFPVPWGYYDLVNVEEVNSSASTVYATKCAATPTDVLGSGTSTYHVGTSVSGPLCY